MTSLLYTAELDLAEDDIKPFLDWYAHRHAPDLVPLGFQSSACYATSGGDMSLFDIYEIPGRDLFYGAGYRRMNERDGYAAPILEKRRNKAHTIYAQHALDIGDLSPTGLLDADWITVSRFDSAAEPDALAGVLSDNATWRDADIAAVRFGSRTTDHPVYTTTRPRYMLLIEWLRRPTAGSELIERVTTALDRTGAVSRQITFEGNRLYPWPNDEEARRLRR